MPTPGQVISGRYRLVASVSESAAAQVFRAEDETARCEVAIRFPLLGAQADARAEVDRFIRDARIAMSVDHRNVVRTLDCGVVDAQAVFVVTEALSGETLADRLVREPKLSAAQFVQVIAAALRGLAALHDAGIVHRDLKPAHIFLQREGDTVFPKIGELGVLQKGSVVGACAYTAPELLFGDAEPDKRCDVYSMAAVLFAGLAGRAPFEAETSEALLALVRTSQTPDLRTLCPELPPALADVVGQAMARERERRFADARALRNALMISAEPLLAPGAAPSASHSTDARRTGGAAEPPRGDARARVERDPKPSPAKPAGGWGDFEGIVRPQTRPSVELAAVALAPADPQPAAPPPRTKAAGRSSAAEIDLIPVGSIPALDGGPGDRKSPPGRAGSRDTATAQSRVGRQSQQLAVPVEASPASAGVAAAPAAGPARVGRASQEMPAPPGRISKEGRPQAPVPSRGSKDSRSVAAVPARGAADARAVADPNPPPAAEPARPASKAAAAVAVPTGPGLEVDAFDPLYAGADQATPDLDYERIHSDGKKKDERLAPVDAQADAQGGARPAAARGRNKGGEYRSRRRRSSARSWILPLIALLLLGYVFFDSFFGGFAVLQRFQPAIAGGKRPDEGLSGQVDPALRALRIRTKARRANPGKLTAHMRDIEF